MFFLFVVDAVFATCSGSQFCQSVYSESACNMFPDCKWTGGTTSSWNPFPHSTSSWNPVTFPPGPNHFTTLTPEEIDQRFDDCMNNQKPSYSLCFAPALIGFCAFIYFWLTDQNMRNKANPLFFAGVFAALFSFFSSAYSLFQGVNTSGSLGCLHDLSFWHGDGTNKSGITDCNSALTDLQQATMGVIFFAGFGTFITFGATMVSRFGTNLDVCGSTSISEAKRKLYLALFPKFGDVMIIAVVVWTLNTGNDEFFGGGCEGKWLDVIEGNKHRLKTTIYFIVASWAFHLLKYLYARYKESKGEGEDGHSTEFFTPLNDTTQVGRA